MYPDHDAVRIEGERVWIEGETVRTEGETVRADIEVLSIGVIDRANSDAGKNTFLFLIVVIIYSI